MKVPLFYSFFTKFFASLGFIQNTELRSIDVVEINFGDSLFQTTNLHMIPPNVDDLYSQAQSHGYKGECSFDSITAFLKKQGVGFILDGTKWILISAKKAPQELWEYAIAHGYKGSDDCRSVGLHLQEMGMTPVRHPDGHWSIEPTPHF